MVEEDLTGSNIAKHSPKKCFYGAKPDCKTPEWKRDMKACQRGRQERKSFWQVQVTFFRLPCETLFRSLTLHCCLSAQISAWVQQNMPLFDYWGNNVYATPWYQEHVSHVLSAVGGCIPPLHCHPTAVLDQAMLAQIVPVPRKHGGRLGSWGPADDGNIWASTHSSPESITKESTVSLSCWCQALNRPMTGGG